MPLIESAPDPIAADQSTESPGQQSGTISSLAAAMAMVGIAALTLGWALLLVRATIWLFRG